MRQKITQPSARPTRKVLVQAVAGLVTAVLFGLGQQLVAAVPGLGFLADPGVREAIPVLAGAAAGWLVREVAPAAWSPPIRGERGTRGSDARVDSPAGAVMLALAAGLLLAGCASGATLGPDATAAQRLYALKSDYANVLALTAEYAEECAGRPPGAKRGCGHAVAQIREVDAELVWPAIERAERARAEGRGIALSVAAEAARAGIARLRAVLRAEAVEPPNQDAGETP